MKPEPPLCNECKFYSVRFYVGDCNICQPSVRCTLAREMETLCGPDATSFVRAKPIPKPGLGYVEAGR